jgi:hypothetical protein
MDVNDTILLQLQTLDKEIEVKINEYQELVKNYLQNISSSTTTNTTNKNLVIYPNSEFWGTSGIDSGYVNNENECVNMCLNNASCTGATYNKQKKYCWARTGESQVIHNSSGNKKTVSILNENNISNLNSMKVLNDSIIDLQNKKMNILKNTNNSTLFHNNEIEQKKIDEVLEKLNIENNKLQTLLQKEYAYNREYDDSSLIVTRNTLYYNIFFFIIVVIILFGISSFF